MMHTVQKLLKKPELSSLKRANLQRQKAHALEAKQTSAFSSVDNKTSIQQRTQKATSLEKESPYGAYINAV